MRVSDVVTIDKIESWIPGDLITIKSGTGGGKSYLIKNILYPIAKRDGKKILMLTHRSNCATQFKEELARDDKLDVIKIMTYQKLEYMYMKSNEKDLSEYQYIVCDEFHYFMGDASFSKTTDISLDLILSQIFATRIFMSATGDHMKTYINDIKNKETIDYELPIVYDFIECLTFFYKDETLEAFIDEAIEKKHKVIFFIQSAKKAYELYKKYKDHCLFNCSKNNKDYYKYVDKDKVNNMLTNERFESLILITTTCMDTGVNIIDLDLKHIICDVEDTGTLIQCIGRKRIQNDKDKFHLYIKAINNRSLGGKITQLNKKLKMAEFLKSHTVKEFIDEYQREYDTSNMVYDATVREKDKGTKKINELMFFKCKVDLEEIKGIIELGKYGYYQYIKELFEMEEYRLIEEDYKTDELIKFLDRIIGKQLYKADQKELIENVDIKDKRGRIQKSMSIFNAYFDENNLPYIIKSDTNNIKKLENGNANIHFRKTYWKVYKLLDSENTINVE